MIYKFGDYLFNGFNLTRNEKPIKITPTQRKFLNVLLEKAASNPNAPVLLEEFWNAVWGNEKVVDLHRVSVHLSELRKKLKEKPDGMPYISTGDVRIDLKVERVDSEVSDSSLVFEFPEDTFIESQPLSGADPNNSPYPGPQPFPANFAKYFFGRNEDVKHLCELISNKQKRVILMYSPSGAGKTSLLNTALRNNLKENFNLLPMARLGVPAVKEISGQNPYISAAIASMQENVGEFNNEISTLNNYLSSVKKLSEKDTVVFIDQAEEILTINLGSYQNKTKFFIEIREALEVDSNISFLIAFREEYLAEIQRVAHELSEFWTLYPLPLLDLQNAEKAVCFPAKHFGVKFDPDVLSGLITKLAGIRYIDHLGNPREETSEFVAPLQLQLACDKLWKKLEKGQKVIKLQDLLQTNSKDETENSILKPDEIVTRFVDSAINDFCNKAIIAASCVEGKRTGYEFSSELIYLGCQQFISDQGIRIPVRKGKTETGSLPNGIVEELARQQFLRVEYRYGEAWFEIAHDTLISPLMFQIEKIEDKTLQDIFSRFVRRLIDEGNWEGEKPEVNDIIQESCLVFIDKDGSRKQVSQDFLEKDASRLPLYFIESFVQCGILRKSVTPSGEVYEMAHPRLALAIHREKFLALNRLYKTRKLLETYQDQLKSLDNETVIWDDKSEKLLIDIKEILGVENLTEKDAEFVLIVSLASGLHLDYFLLQINKFYPVLVENILNAAIKNPENPIVRRNGAYALGLLDFKTAEAELFNLAIFDKDETVRKTAAISIAKIEEINSWLPVFSHLNKLEMRLKTLKSLAWIYDTLSEEKLKHFQNESKTLSFWLRFRLHTTILDSRFRNAQIKILLILVVLLITTIISTAPPRAILGAFNATMTQVTVFGLIEGAFHGVAGAVLWSLFIGVPLLFWWFVGERRRPWKGNHSFVIGALGGLVGGIVNTFVVMEVFGKDSLAKINWISTPQSDSTEVLMVTGMAFALPIYGAFIGLGSGEAARRMLLWWGKEFAPESEITKTVCKKAAKLSLWIFLPMLTAAFAFYLVLLNMPRQTVTVRQLLGESVSLFFGGFGLIVGLFLGLHIVRQGLPSLENQEEILN